jgi:hypothetical protein
MAAPIEPFAGFVMEGGNGFATSRDDGFGDVGLTGAVDTGAGLIVTPVKVMVGSSVIIASSKPAQPSWLSTALGS